MSVDLAGYEERAARAVQTFWSTRTQAATASGDANVGNRGAVTAGKNLDGFFDLVQAVVVANGLRADSVYCGTQTHARSRHTVLPGYYRPSKDWDVLVIQDDELVAAIELKSQVGSFGNNFNNRAEEAIGMGEDPRVAFREGLYDAATVLLSDAEGGATGAFRDVSPATSLRAFIARLAARVSEVAARTGRP